MLHFQFDAALIGMAKDLAILVSTLEPERRHSTVNGFVEEVEKQLQALTKDTTEDQILCMISEGCPNTQGF
ncbi:MAG: hypothetical protein L0Z62_26595 [Gemmataceae bacterium]|nr:hypothetical protein [Gemmataceae bacterium]